MRRTINLLHQYTMLSSFNSLSLSRRSITHALPTSPSSMMASTPSLASSSFAFLATFLVFTILLLSSSFLLLTPTSAQLLDPSSMVAGRVQIQFPDYPPLPSTPRLFDTNYLDIQAPYQLYTPTPITSLTMNVSFRTGLPWQSDATSWQWAAKNGQAFILIQLMNITKGPAGYDVLLERKNISVNAYPFGYCLITFGTLPPDSSSYYFSVQYVYLYTPSYITLAVTQNMTDVLDSRIFIGGVNVLQYPELWDRNQPALPTSVSIPSSYNGQMPLLLSAQIQPYIQYGAFTFEIMFDMRRLTDGRQMTQDLIAQGLTTFVAHWARENGSDPVTYFNLSINSFNSPTLRLPPPLDRFVNTYQLFLDDLHLPGYRAEYSGISLAFYPLRRVTAWTIQMEFGGNDTMLSDMSFKEQSEHEYATQSEEYTFLISQYQSYLTLQLADAMCGQMGQVLLQWQSGSLGDGIWNNRSLSFAPSQADQKVPLPLVDQSINVRLTTALGQQFTWHFNRVQTASTANQTQVLQTYQTYENQLVQVSKNLTASKPTNPDHFQLISQSSTSVSALQRFTSDHPVTSSIPATQFLTKTIDVTVTPTTLDISTKRDVYILSVTPNPLSWVKSEPVVIGNVTQPAMGLLPDSSAVSITLADINGQSLTNSQLNQGNLTALTSYSYSVVQSYDTVDSCPSASCVPECRIYDPTSVQWIRTGIDTEVIVATGTVKCSSSTPGTIALLRSKIVTRTDVDPDTDGSLRYGHAKNDMALVIGLLVVAGVLFILMFIGGLFSFMRETREMQAQINELKKAMMEDQETSSSSSSSRGGGSTRDRDDSHSKSQEQSEVSFLPPAPPSMMMQHNQQHHQQYQHHHQHHHHHQHQHQHQHHNPYLRSDDQLESPSIQVSLLESPSAAASSGMMTPSLLTVNSYSNSFHSYNASPSIYLAPTTPFDLPTTESEAILAGDLPFPRVSQLRPQFRPLTDAELAVQYGVEGYDY